MASLRMLTGNYPGRIYELQEDRNILGRHASCQIVLENVAVSRQHAQIVENQSRYFVEDLRSRNGTFVNGQPVEGRVYLNDRDKIRICDLHFRFHTSMESSSVIGDSTHLRDNPTEVDADLQTIEQQHNTPVSDPGSTILKTVGFESHSKVEQLAHNAEVKLKAVLDITAALVNVLNMNELLPKILSSLFEIFPQAETGYIVLRDPDTGFLEVKAVKSLSPKQSKALEVSETVIERVLEHGEAILSADAQEDERFTHSDSIPRLKIRSMMCAPLVAQSGERLGLIELNTRDLSQEFSEEDLEILVSVSSQAVLTLENARMHEELLSQRDLERDLEYATQIQLGFLPKERPVIQGYRFFDFYEAALRVGGDYYDYIPLPDGKLAVCVGDVSGKGVTAALLMARLYSSMRYLMLMQPDPRLVLQALNEEIYEGGVGFRFITLVIAILDPEKHEIVISSAGHLPPLLCKGDNSTEYLGFRKAGVPLGIMENSSYTSFTTTLSPGDKVLFYTDGVTETMNNDEKLYGREHLAEVVAKLPATIDQIVKGIVRDVENYGGHIAPRDDICIVGLERENTESITLEP